MQKPKGLNKQGRDTFDELSKIIEVTDRNIHSLTILADLLSRYREAQSDLNKNGLTFVSSQGVPRANPAANFILKVVPQIRALSERLGLDRAGPNDPDPLADFMGA